MAAQYALKKFWQMEQAIVHLLLFFAMFFLTIIVLDEGYDNSPKSHKRVLGIIVVILIFIIISWNLLSAVYELFSRIIQCHKQTNFLNEGGLLPNAHSKNYEQIIEQSNPQVLA